MSSPSDQKRLNPVDLRRQAESRIAAHSSDVARLPDDEIRRLAYELEVYQEELEIQNEELRRVQTELVASHERYADLYDFAPVGYLTLDEMGFIFKSNLMAATMLGRERPRLIGSRLGQYCHPNSRIQLRDLLVSVRTSATACSCELEFLNPAGNRLFTRLDSNPMTILPDNDWQCRVVMTDITQRKLAEQAAIEKDQHLKSVTNSIPVLIAYIDSTRKYQWANAAYQEWFEIPVDTIPGQGIDEVLGSHSAREIDDFLADALAGRRVDFETELTHRRNGQRHVQVMLIPDVASNGKVKGVHSLCLDITERVVVEGQKARRRHYSEQLVQLNSGERKIYDLLIRGKSNKAIASELDIGLRTAERRRKTILSKLKVDSLAELLQQLAKANE